MLHQKKSVSSFSSGIPIPTKFFLPLLKTKYASHEKKKTFLNTKDISDTSDVPTKCN